MISCLHKIVSNKADGVEAFFSYSFVSIRGS